MKNVTAAIQAAERLLPGRAAPKNALDPRWQAIIAAAEFVDTNPDELWEFSARWGSHRSADLRAAISTCVLEHLLEHHFETIFPRAEALAQRNRNFASTFVWLGPLAKRLYLAMLALFVELAGPSNMPSNHALERSVKGSSGRAAGARTIIAPAARWNGLARPAQRGR